MTRVMMFFFLIFIMTSCVNFTYKVGDPNVATSNESSVKGVVCDDESILKMKEYKTPSMPTFDGLPEGDRVAELKLLINHIHLLMDDIEYYIKDYKCQ